MMCQHSSQLQKAVREAWVQYVLILKPTIYFLNNIYKIDISVIQITQLNRFNKRNNPNYVIYHLKKIMNIQ